MDKFREPEQFDAEVEIHGGEPFAVWAPAVNGSHVKAELYFALLAELEAKDKRIAELEAIRADASLVFKEIGNELGCNPDNESIMMAIDELKAQVKVWESAATKHLARAEEAEQRIAELSELETHNECLIKKNADLTQQNIKLGERLATPVRLSCETHPRCRTQHAKDVRAAGFKVTGDA
ncbi:hypothetical protein [Serratia sp. CY76391]|uniref:hypothetical protein n=1 Tax=Serratia sp. CY76391 TaxID=3383681 RepID=UPI003FA14441